MPYRRGLIDELIQIGDATYAVRDLSFDITDIGEDIQIRASLVGWHRGGVWDPKRIKKVIFNDPATIVFWYDGTKTVVKCQAGDKYDKMTGLAMAISKKFLGNTGRYYNTFRPWLEAED